jgi:hypothetical protein
MGGNGGAARLVGQVGLERRRHEPFLLGLAADVKLARAQSAHEWLTGPAASP